MQVSGKLLVAASRRCARRSEMAQDFFVGAGEGEVVKLRKREPLAVELGARLLELSVKSFQDNSVSGDGMFDDAEWYGRGESKRGDLVVAVSPLRTVPRCSNCGAHVVTCPTVASSNLDIGEFPEVRVHHSIRSLADEKSAVALSDEGDETANGKGSAFA